MLVGCSRPGDPAFEVSISERWIVSVPATNRSGWDGTTMGPYPDPKDAYLDYRRLKSADPGRLSPKMMASINALESRLGTRGRPQPEMARMANSKNLVKNVMLQKQAQAFENRTKATLALRSFLESRANVKNNPAPFSPAAALKDEPELLADFLLAANAGVKWIPGHLKKLENSMGKREAPASGKEAVF